jgi:hypothetical protein
MMVAASAGGCATTQGRAPAARLLVTSSGAVPALRSGTASEVGQPVPSQKWRVLVTKLGVDNVLYEGDVDATNWMGALRAAREGMAERPSVPPGVSCSIDGQGVATVLDPGSRRRFVLAPGASAAAKAAAPAPANNAKRAEPPIPANPVPSAQPAQPAQPAPTRGKRFETVAFVPDKIVERPVSVAGSSPPPPQAWPAPVAKAPVAKAPAAKAPAAAAPVAAPSKKKKFETVAFSPAMQGAAAAADPTPRDQPAVAPPVRVADSGPIAAASRPSTAPARRAGIELELLLERNEEPTQENPLFYCERAYLLPRGVSVADAEAALRWKLADMQKALDARKRGKLVNLAVFDHRWQEAPERPPVITLQWRDWRGDVVVDYPAAARHSSAPSAPPSGGAQDDRLADVFEALGGLGRLGSAADALDFAVQLLDRTVLSEAVSACLYDINTDELRFVALSGTGADGLQGRAVPRSSGLFGQAARLEHHASVFKDVFVEPAYDPEVDSRPGLDARSILLRPIVHEHQLLGMLQLINRKGKLEFTGEDAHLVSYIAERLAEFINAARRTRSQHPPGR